MRCVTHFIDRQLSWPPLSLSNFIPQNDIEISCVKSFLTYIYVCIHVKRKYQKYNIQNKTIEFVVITSLPCKLWHLIVNGDCINLFVDQKILFMNLYAYMSLYICKEEMRLLLVIVIVVEQLSHPSSYLLRMQTGIRNNDKAIYILLETIKGMYVFVHKSHFFSRSLSLVLSLLLCLSSADDRWNKMQILLLLSIHTYIHSIICTVYRIGTDMHLKHSSKKKTIITMSCSYLYAWFHLRCLYFLNNNLFFYWKWLPKPSIFYIDTTYYILQS